MMKRGDSSEEEEVASNKAPAAVVGTSTDPKQHEEAQARNPRHLQWEMRFSQLQRFKAKYGHSQVPIGWPENVQLANWVSKQRQEYKNLLRGRATRLDENRIRLLNSVNFAWQLQRGGRRRQLKAKEHRKKPTDGEKSSDSDGDNEPCILPGEVVIGSGSPTSAGVLPQIKVRGRDSQSQRSQPVAVKEATPSPQHQPIQQSMQPLQQSLQQLSSTPASNMGMQYLNRTAGPLAVQNNDLLDYVLARNALMQNLQTPSSLPTLPRGYPQLGLQTSTSAQRNSLLPVLAPQPSSLFPLTATALTASSTAGGGGAAGGTSSSGPWSTSITSSLLDIAPAGARVGGALGPTDDESKLPDNANARNYKNQLQQHQHQQEQQQQQQQQQNQDNQNFFGSNPSILYGGLGMPGNGESAMDQQSQGLPPN